MSNEAPYEVVMPKLGLIMTEARLAEWYKEEGDWVESGEPLFALESDKSTIDIEAPAAGRVSIVVPAGDTVPVMTPVAYILDEDAAMPKVTSQPIPTPSEETRVKSVSLPGSPNQGKPVSAIRATPKARKLAQDRGLNLAGLQGSGPRDMVVVADLDKFGEEDLADATPVARKMAAECGLNLSELSGTGPNGRITRTDVSKAIAGVLANSPDPSKSTPAAGEKSLPLTGLRGVIARRLSESWRERPQVTLTTEVDATILISARQQINAETGRKVSFNAFFLMAAARALREQPHVNVRLTESGITLLKEINIGLAVDTERGLLVPVLFQVDSKTILALDTEISKAVQRALTGTALPDELSGGTFTITNLGQYGIDAFTPIINPPEAAVLGIGRIAPRPFVVGRQLEVRDTVTLSLSFDHRLLDGAPAAGFLQRIATLIGRPIALTATDYGTE